MSKIKSGKIYRKETEGGRAFISFITKKGNEEEKRLPEEQINALAALLEDTNKENPVEVEFEFVKNRIDRIRPAGTSYSVPQGTSFHNPYNFVPLPNLPSKEKDLGRFKPPEHHICREDKYEGRIDVKLTAASPLLLLDPTTATVANGHKTVDLLRDSNRAPILRPTSFKGALRSAYEAITCSRFGVFHGHDRPLARRMDAGDSLAMMPARISKTGDLELFLGQHTKYPSFNGNTGRWEVPGREMYAAWMPRYTKLPAAWPGYNNESGPVIHSSVNYPNNSSPADGDDVVCWLNLVKCSSPRSEYWEVVWFQPTDSGDSISDETSLHCPAGPAGLSLPRGHSRTRTYQLVTGDVRLDTGGTRYISVRNPNGPVIDKKAVRYPNGSLPQHGDQVVCWLNLVNKGHFKYWRVVWIQRSSSPPSSPSPVTEDQARQLSRQWNRRNHTPTDEYLLAEATYV